MPIDKTKIFLYIYDSSKLIDIQFSCSCIFKKHKNFAFTFQMYPNKTGAESVSESVSRKIFEFY
ncbi:MAG TPA: hypothetical protein DHM44_09280 [Flexistipes sinusarabici]|uniref:Uncharacterized protein n=1 Tax=Flexistipes sinusarabici TaxID=2352 RepID=A0A3D5QF11_FLESI|nr:hypothetical protein [Flexistipes sinusarabici]